MNAPIITLGMRLAMARRMAGMSAKDMARISGYSEKSISRYENDSQPVPAAVLYIYQHECDVSRDYIEGRAELTQEVLSSRCTGESPCQGTLFARAA